MARRFYRRPDIGAFSLRHILRMAGYANRCGLSCINRGWLGGWYRHALRIRLHQRAWRLRNIPAFPALDGGDGDLYGVGFCQRLFNKARIVIVSFLCGLLFGLGLIVSGMANPAKVLGFLDLAGKWDPSLIFVMCGAIAVGFLAFSYVGRRKTTLLGAEIKLPSATKIDRRLVFGSILFGAGWGIAGFCPGPALVGLGMGLPKAIVFVLAMLAGMGIFELVERRRGG